MERRRVRRIAKMRSRFSSLALAATVSPPLRDRVQWTKTGSSNMPQQAGVSHWPSEATNSTPPPTRSAGRKRIPAKKKHVVFWHVDIEVQCASCHRVSIMPAAIVLLGTYVRDVPKNKSTRVLYVFLGGSLNRDTKTSKM